MDIEVFYFISKYCCNCNLPSFPLCQGLLLNRKSTQTFTTAKTGAHEGLCEAKKGRRWYDLMNNCVKNLALEVCEAKEQDYVRFIRRST